MFSILFCGEGGGGGIRPYASIGAERTDYSTGYRPILTKPEVGQTTSTKWDSQDYIIYL